MPNIIKGIVTRTGKMAKTITVVVSYRLRSLLDHMGRTADFQSHRQVEVPKILKVSCDVEAAIS